MPSRLQFLIVLLGLAVSGCGIARILPQAQPQAHYIVGDQLLQDSFDTAGNWYRYDSPGVYLQVENGVYHARIAGGTYVWGINAQAASDVVIEADTNQLSEANNNGYGVICRANADNNGDGYYFLISGDGSYSIRRGRGRDVTALVAWEHSDAIHGGAAANHIRAVCIGDYLALYVNDRFVADTHDDFYHQGMTGFAVVSPSDTPLEVTFDNLAVFAATLAN